MDAYAATGRITQAHPRFVGSGGSRPSSEVGNASADRQAWAVGRQRPLDVRILEGWARACEEWAQATFFLFDPNSWR